MAQAWREALAQYIQQQAKPVEKYGHQPRLYELTRRIGEGLSYDDDQVYAAAWLHDLGVFAGHRPENPEELARWDSVAYALDHSPAILRGFGFPEAKLGGVLECIRTHQPHCDPPCLEATILRDADILEQLGAVGILRTVCKVGRDTRFYSFTDAMNSLQRTLDTLPAQLRLPAARRLAEQRIELHRAFLSGVQREAGTLLL